MRHTSKADYAGDATHDATRLEGRHYATQRTRACCWREAPPFSPRSHSCRKSISSRSSLAVGYLSDGHFYFYLPLVTRLEGGFRGRFLQSALPEIPRNA